MSFSGSGQTLSSACSNSESRPTRNGSLISSTNVGATHKFTGLLENGLKTPSKLGSPVNLSSRHSSSSLSTPEPSSGDSQVSISTPTSNSFSNQDGGHTSSKVFCASNILPAFSCQTINHSASSSHVEEADQPVTNFTFEPASPSPSTSSHQDHSLNLVHRALPPTQRFLKSIPYLDQLDYCFDSQLSPAPVPRQVCSDHLNNNSGVEVKGIVEASPRFLPAVQPSSSAVVQASSPVVHASPSPVMQASSPVVHASSSPVAVFLQPRLDLNPEMQNLKPKKLRPLKPSLKVKTQESNSYRLKTTDSEQKVVPKDFHQLQSCLESAHLLAPTSRSSAGSADQGSKSQCFKTDISSFYSSSVRPVLPAVQYGQNSIPLAKKRKNSAEFWNVELFEDGTEDLFMEKPKRFRGSRKKMVVGSKVSKGACNIKLFEDTTGDLFTEELNRSWNCTRTKVVNKKVNVTVPDQLGLNKVPSDPPGRIKVPSDQTDLIKVLSDKPGLSLIKVPSDQPGLVLSDMPGPLRSIIIASPIVSKKAKVEVKSAFQVQNVEPSKHIKNEVVKSKVRKSRGVCSTLSPNCTGCADLRLQLKRIKDKDVENNLDDVEGLSNLCGDCGTVISLKSEEGKDLFDFVDTDIVEIYEDSPKEMSHNLNESEDDNDIGKLVMDVDEVTEVASPKESDGDATMSVSSESPSLFSAVCWSCKSTKSLGSWHAHKWQHDKFLCSSCFSFYKEKNAESSRKKTSLPEKKSNQSGTISNLINPRASELLELLTVPQHIPNLQNLPPVTHDFRVQVEADLASISS